MYYDKLFRTVDTTSKKFNEADTPAKTFENKIESSQVSTSKSFVSSHQIKNNNTKMKELH